MVVNLEVKSRFMSSDGVFLSYSSEELQTPLHSSPLIGSFASAALEVPRLVLLDSNHRILLTLQISFEKCNLS